MSMPDAQNTASTTELWGQVKDALRVPLAGTVTDQSTLAWVNENLAALDSPVLDQEEARQPLQRLDISSWKETAARGTTDE